MIQVFLILIIFFIVLFLRKVERVTVVGLCLSVCSVISSANAEDTAKVNVKNADDIVGKWYVLHPKTNKRTLLCSVYKESQGTYFAKVDRIYPNQEGNTVKYCHKCPSPYKEKPIYDMVILWNMTPITSKIYDHATGIDPRNGSLYRAQVIYERDLNRMAVNVKYDQESTRIKEYWVKVIE